MNLILLVIGIFLLVCHYKNKASLRKLTPRERLELQQKEEEEELRIKREDF